MINKFKAQVKRFLKPMSILLLVFTFQSCQNTAVPREEPKRESIFGEGGLTKHLFGSDSSEEQAAKGSKNIIQEKHTVFVGIGVNPFLWRAALDIISFMPLISVDAYSGTIITDWHSPNGTPNERFKTTVYVLHEQLSSDALKIQIFHQTRENMNAPWRQLNTDLETIRNLEDTIFTHALDLQKTQN